MTVILETSGLTKSFGGFVAVNSVNLTVEKGHIHALIGPNGAGKTTCFNLLTKFYRPTAGTIFYDGEDITRFSPDQVAKKGIIRSFQISSVFPHMTVLENIRIPLQRKLSNSYSFLKSERCLDSLNNEAIGILKQVGLDADASSLASELSYGRKRSLELAATIAMDPKVMFLDEPTQGMGAEDVDRIRDLIKALAVGRTVIIVEHNMNVVSSISDRITVLQRGSVLASGTYSEVSKNPEVIEAYMGTVGRITATENA
ncbi:ABC transporter ATP-binding protein [Allorhizobium pseudoryzae]|uniref:ABC transporter ATP-binding protein n=1 Tax=Allorhizobium pseudoryzae TaxID=379684 RepID=UPI003D01F2A4